MNHTPISLLEADYWNAYQFSEGIQDKLKHKYYILLLTIYPRYLFHPLVLLFLYCIKYKL